MATEWKMGTARELLAELRKAGFAQGHSAKFPRYLRLHKTDLMSDIRKMPENTNFTWKVGGDPDVTSRYANNRRSVIIWLGQ
jgi:hypothetical protein